MISTGQAIGVLGGTFDPVHNGHIAIAKSFLQSDYINSLLILLTPEPPHKKEQHLTNYNERLRMLMAAFKPVDNTKVSDLEYTLPAPSYTYQTLRYLKKNWPDNDFFLCLGEDSYHNFRKWHRWKGIITLSELLVAARPGTKKNKDDKKIAPYAHFVEHTPVLISSSKIREKIKNNLPVEEFVPEAVLELIKKENLYR